MDFQIQNLSMSARHRAFAAGTNGRGLSGQLDKH
jgi:hypothetical protein